MTSKNHSQSEEEFFELVNMDASELERWLNTDEAKSVGWVRDSGQKKSADGEKSEGYKSGEMILGILSKKRDDLTDDDYAHMRRVNGYIKRHLAQQPNRDITNTRWRYSLMNWGHDPLKN